MGPSETRAMEILLAMSRGRSLASLVTDEGWQEAAAMLLSWQFVSGEGTLTEKGQEFTRLVKDEAMYRIKYGTRPA
ncbi:MAG: hypothetical protein KF841_14235 [Phycisphaerae bacterium]|nr:hypothetical protein [Phycisphaerae bacterium]